MYGGKLDKVRILAVDDDKGLLLSIKASLLSAGMPEPAIVSDSREAMDLIRKNPFQLVLIDLIMPHMEIRRCRPRRPMRSQERDSFLNGPLPVRPSVRQVAPCFIRECIQSKTVALSITVEFARG